MALTPAAAASLTGVITDPQGHPATAAQITLQSSTGYSSRSDAAGHFSFSSLPAGIYTLTASTPNFVNLTRPITLTASSNLNLNLQFTQLTTHTETLTVTADLTSQNITSPDPAQRTVIRDEILDANPGRPGAPVSIPGIPIESASGGIKAPQYFAPGVAGDHGEPIASFLQIGSFLLPNNLSANAHGNGFADPNILVPSLIEAVQIDGGAFNVLEGNHSVDLAATYALRQKLQPAATLTADNHDADLSTGWRWLALQASSGNGFLATPEHRQQYKFNISQSWTANAHHLSFLLLGYYGKSRIPGLVPINVPNLHDTIDPRQKDQTHTGIVALNDVWNLGQGSELHLSSFFRTYNLNLTSDFGDGLIRQSEFRTVSGANTNYIRKINERLTLMAGVDYLRDAPRRDDLDRFAAGAFQSVTSNNITLNLLTPFISLDGAVTPWLHYNLGWRRDQIDFINTDLLFPTNSFHRWVGINSPKATVSLFAPDKLPLPSLSLSWGQAFFTNDPRIGMGSQQGSLVTQAHSYQLVVNKTVRNTALRLTLGRVTQQASLAKIDPDTGLQFNEGPSRNRWLTLSARHDFHRGFLQASISKADARDLSAGAPIPEAPRLIIDVLGSLDRLPFHLQARAEFEEVGRKPLGDSFISLPVREYRVALIRPFLHQKLTAGIHLQLSSGYTGQTTEVIDSTERIVGVYLPSYATLSLTYHF